jgi:NADH:ubiquinone oxidoreductase subunit 4 (subunit M)
MLQKIFLGVFRDEEYHELSDARTTEWVAISCLAVALLLVGVFPRPLVDLIGSGLKAAPGVRQARVRGPGADASTRTAALAGPAGFKRERATP